LISISIWWRADYFRIDKEKRTIFYYYCWLDIPRKVTNHIRSKVNQLNSCVRLPVYITFSNRRERFIKINYTTYFLFSLKNFPFKFYFMCRCWQICQYCSAKVGLIQERVKIGQRAVGKVMITDPIHNGLPTDRNKVSLASPIRVFRPKSSGWPAFLPSTVLIEFLSKVPIDSGLAIVPLKNLVPSIGRGVLYPP